jgi:hypothetical protein
MELNYRDLQARPLRPTLADRYWANPAHYNRQGCWLIVGLLLVLANVIG